MNSLAVLAAPHFDIAAIQRQVGEQVAEFERRLLIEMLAKQIHRLTLNELAEFITGPVGSKIGSLTLSSLFDAIPRASDAPPASGLPERTAADTMASSPTPGLGVAEVAPPHTAPPPPPPASTPVRAVIAEPLDATDLAAAVRDALAAAPGPLSAADIRRALQCSEVQLSEVLRTLRADGAIEKSGVARGTRYAPARVPAEPAPVEAVPVSPTSLSEFDAAVLEAVRLAGDWIAFPDLLKSLRCSEEGLRATLHRLVGQGTVRRSHTPHATIYKSRSVV